MAILSKSEILFLQGQKKAKSCVQVKVRHQEKTIQIMDNELSLLSSLFPNLNLYLAKKLSSISPPERRTQVQSSTLHFGI